MAASIISPCFRFRLWRILVLITRTFGLHQWRRSMALNKIMGALFFRATTMSVQGKILMLAAIMLSMPFVDWSAETRARQRDDEINKIFASLREPGTPGAAILVKKDGKIVLRRNYGLRDLRNKVPIDSKTNFRLASCTKQFTAM